MHEVVREERRRVVPCGRVGSDCGVADGGLHAGRLTTTNADSATMRRRCDDWWL